MEFVPTYANVHSYALTVHLLNENLSSSSLWKWSLKTDQIGWSLVGNDRWSFNTG